MVADDVDGTLLRWAICGSYMSNLTANIQPSLLLLRLLIVSLTLIYRIEAVAAHQLFTAAYGLNHGVTGHFDFTLIGACA